MKVPKTFIPEKDFTNKINQLLEDVPQSLYDYTKRVYDSFKGKNIFLLYGPPGTGKTFMSEKTREALSKEYDIFQICLQPVDSYTVTKSKYFSKLENNIHSALSLNKKVYVEIKEIEKFTNPAQETLDKILIKYKNNRNIVFVFESSYQYLPFFQEDQTIDIEFTKKKL